MCSEDVSQGLGSADQWLALAWHTKQDSAKTDQLDNGEVQIYTHISTAVPGTLCWWPTNVARVPSIIILPRPRPKGSTGQDQTASKLCQHLLEPQPVLTASKSELLGPACLYPLYTGYIYRVYVTYLYISIYIFYILVTVSILLTSSSLTPRMQH